CGIGFRRLLLAKLLRLASEAQRRSGGSAETRTSVPERSREPEPPITAAPKAFGVAGAMDAEKDAGTAFQRTNLLPQKGAGCRLGTWTGCSALRPGKGRLICLWRGFENSTGLSGS